VNLCRFDLARGFPHSTTPSTNWETAGLALPRYCMLGAVHCGRRLRGGCGGRCHRVAGGIARLVRSPRQCVCVVGEGLLVDSSEN
jgi:hypothetical protein